MRHQIISLLIAGAPLLARVQAAVGLTGPLFKHEHPDPCIIRLKNGTYYSFADAQAVARSDTTDLRGKWHELPDITVNFDQGGDWTTGKFGGGPDVTQLSDGTFILYFTGIPTNQGADTGKKPDGDPVKPKMCIGAATSHRILGPYSALSTPYICGYGVAGTGFIAPSLFQHDNKNFFLYKNGSAFDPAHRSRIYMKQVGLDGLTNVTQAREIYNVSSLDKHPDEYDAEGPTMSFHDGVFFLFYDAGFYAKTNYRIDYAVSRSLHGPFTFKGNLIRTGTYQGIHLTSPGGIDFVGDSSTEMTFMAYEPGATVDPDGRVHGIRQLHAATLEYSGETVRLAGSGSG